MENEEITEKKSTPKRIKEFAMTTTNGMAIGLFGTLIIGTIINLFAQIPGLAFVGTWASAIQGLMGAGIGLGVALSLKKSGVACIAEPGGSIRDDDVISCCDRYGMTMCFTHVRLFHH